MRDRTLSSLGLYITSQALFHILRNILIRKEMKDMDGFQAFPSIDAKINEQCCF